MQSYISVVATKTPDKANEKIPIIPSQVIGNDTGKIIPKNQRLPQSTNTTMQTPVEINKIIQENEKFTKKVGLLAQSVQSLIVVLSTIVKESKLSYGALANADFQLNATKTLQSLEEVVKGIEPDPTEVHHIQKKVKINVKNVEMTQNNGSTAEDSSIISDDDSFLPARTRRNKSIRRKSALNKHKRLRTFKKNNHA